MIIDFHTHSFPDRLAQRAIKVLEGNMEPYSDKYGMVKAVLDGTASSLSRSTEESGIDLSVVMPIATSKKSASTINKAAQLINETGNLRSFGSVHPLSETVTQDLEEIKDLGLIGVKLHPEYQQCYADSDETVSLVKKAKELGLWVLFHSGEDVGMPPPVHCAPNHIINLCKKTNYERLIFAHMGGFNLFDEVAKAADIYKSFGVYIDTSVSVDKVALDSLMGDSVAETIRKIGSDHVLFGSDSPWNNQREALDKTVAFLNHYNFSNQDIENIVGKNAAGILGIT